MRRVGRPCGGGARSYLRSDPVVALTHAVPKAYRGDDTSSRSKPVTGSYRGVHMELCTLQDDELAPRTAAA
jgi:hypothetical protein